MGDFWDAYFTSFDKFINSKWNALFPLLKERHTVYLYGNHDKAENMNDMTSLFADYVGKEISFEHNGKTFVLEHGDEIADTFTIDPKHPFVNKLIKRLSIGIVWVQKFIVKIFGIKTFRALWGLQRQNRLLIESVNKNKGPDVIKIYGHTHIPLFSLDDNLIILGGIRLGNANYLIIDQSGEIKTVEEKY